MYIKSIIIEGFKSYSDRTIVGPFHPGHNVVVGRNGSGKSNFFSAIEFVLSPEFSNLSSEKARIALLHRGVGPQPINAFVEIIFDNSDGRFPLESEEVTIRRVIGSKKDQFFINGKLASSKSEIQGDLETAGLSCSNPYYIVKQGQINHIASCTASRRLKVIKEVAGAGVYEEKMVKAEQQLVITNNMIDEIEENLKNIRNKLEQLTEENEALEEYRKADRQKRALEFTILEADIEDNTKKQREVEMTLQNDSVQTTTKMSSLKKAEEDLMGKRNKVERLKCEKAALDVEHVSLQKSYDSMLSQKEKMILKKRDLEELLAGTDEAKLEEVTSEYDSLTVQLKNLENSLDAVCQDVNTKDEYLSLLTRKLDQTYTRLGRGQQFTSRDERDEWIQKELETIRAQIEKKNLQLNELETFSENTKLNLREKETEIKSRKEDLNKVKSEQMEAHQTLTQALQQKAKLCREHNESCIHLQTLRTEAVAEQERSRNLRTKMASFGGVGQILSGWDSIRHVLQELPELEKQYHGMVIQNIETEKIMQTVIDEIGGNRLFHHIVDTDQVATTLIRKINLRKLPGTFSFMPLNRIQPKSQHKFSETPDAFLLLPRLKYASKVKVIMNYLFGRVLVCRNMATVVRLARETGFDCITPDGERGSSRGVLQGGYINKDNSKMATFPEYHSSREKLTEIRDRIDIAEGKKESWGMKIEEVFGKIEKMKGNLSRNEILITELNDNLKDEKRMALVERVREEEAQMFAMKKELKLLKEGVRELEGEMAGDMASQLNEEEREHCEGIAKEIEELKKSFKKKVAEKTDLLKKRFLMQGRMQNLSKEMRVTHEDHRKRTEWERAMEVMELELEHMESRLEEEKTGLSTLMRKIESMENKIMELLQNLDSDENIVRKYEEELEKIKTKKDTGSNLKARLVSAESDLRKKKDNLGGLPPNVLKKLKGTSRKLLGKQLEKVLTDLEQLAHVNQKAEDQLTSITAENSRLTVRQKKMEESKAALMETINVLNNRRSEQILYTYRQIYRHFSDVFERIVPGGRAELMLTGSVQEGSDQEKLEAASGLSTSVSFSSDSAAMKNMEQLSGGQKTVVALTFILAIQKCDPSPFYLFDEVDAALDADYRAAVAEVIHDQSSTAQFITTTFRPELLSRADKHFGVLFRGKASSILTVERENAVKFVEEEVVTINEQL